MKNALESRFAAAACLATAVAIGAIPPDVATTPPSSRDGEALSPHLARAFIAGALARGETDVKVPPVRARIEPGADNAYVNCTIDRRPPETDIAPRGVPRLRSGNHDAFHSKMAAHGPILDGCRSRPLANCRRTPPMPGCSA